MRAALQSNLLLLLLWMTPGRPIGISVSVSLPPPPPQPAYPSQTASATRWILAAAAAVSLHSAVHPKKHIFFSKREGQTGSKRDENGLTERSATAAVAVAGPPDYAVNSCRSSGRRGVCVARYSSRVALLVLSVRVVPSRGSPPSLPFPLQWRGLDFS